MKRFPAAGIVAITVGCQPSGGQPPVDGPEPTATVAPDAPPPTDTAALVTTTTAATVADAATASARPRLPVRPRSSPFIGFDDLTADAAPIGFTFGRTGSGAEGRWVVRSDPSAPSPPNVLAQVDADPTDARFPVAVRTDRRLYNVDVSVRCKMVSGKIDQACGLVARYQDPDNYYVARANALEGNVRVYVVLAGKRKQLASWSGAVTSGSWHQIALAVIGDELIVSWNGQRVLEHRDGTFGEPGLGGVWTKADSVTYFDDLLVTSYK